MSKLAKATAALETSVGLILDSDVDEATKRSELAETFEQFESYVTGKVLTDDDNDDDGDDTEKRADDHASKVADLLVEAGSFPHRAAALHHLLHKPSGQALLTRMKKKESPMQDTVLSIMKSGGIAGTCAAIVANGSTTITEHELVEAATEVAAERHPELTKSQAFAKVFTAPTDEARCLQAAVGIAKTMPFVADLTPTVVTGTDTRDLSDESEAIAHLKELGRQKWLTASEAQQFANAFTDPVNAKLAAKAHRRPVAPAGGVYPMPR